MNDTEDLLRDAMREYTDGLRLGPVAGAAALVGARRRTRRARVTGATVGGLALVLVAMVGWAGFGSRGDESVGPAAGSSKVTFTAPSPLPSDPPAALLGVSLPDPAPGFPVRISQPTRPILTKDFGTSFWSRTWVLGLTRRNFADASVIVGDIRADGLSTPSTIQGDKVQRTTSVQGHPAFLTHHKQDGPVDILYFASGRFTVMITGGKNTTPDELISLGNALTGLQ